MGRNLRLLSVKGREKRIDRKSFSIWVVIFVSLRYKGGKNVQLH